MTGLPDLTPPTDRFQVEFLTKIQRLLAEGEFTATYKFALLMALADIAIEKGDDHGCPLRVGLDDIAESPAVSKEPGSRGGRCLSCASNQAGPVQE